MLLFFLLDIENAYVLMIFGSLLPALCIGFIFFFLTDYMNKRIGLLVIRQGRSLNQVDYSLAEGGNYETQDGSHSPGHLLYNTVDVNEPNNID